MNTRTRSFPHAMCLGLWLALVLPASAALATDPLLLTLEAAITHALEHNPALAAATAGATAAAAGVDERRAARLPSIALEAGALRTTHPVAVFGNLLSQERFGAENFDPDFLNQPPALTNVHERVRVTQPIWTGGRIGAAVAAAEHQRDAAEHQRERARQELVYRVIDRYTGAIVAERHLDLVAQSRKSAQANVALVEDLFRGGLVVESDLLQAQVRLSELAEQHARAASGVHVARAALNLELGRDLATPYALPTALEPPATQAADLAAASTETASTRPDLAAARAGVEAARAAARAEHRARWPELGVEGGFERNAPDLFDSAGSSWSVGLGLRWNAFDGFATRARTRRAEAELESAEQLARLAEQGAQLELESALRAIEAAELRWQEAQKSVRLAERSQTIVADRYREGLTTVVELLDAETTTSAAHTRELVARRDLSLAHAAFRLAAGTLSGSESQESPTP